jgi:hypothetical protein
MDKGGAAKPATCSPRSTPGSPKDFIRVEGWVGNLSIHIEHEFFGLQGPSADFKDRYGREGRSIRGLSVEEHLVRLRENLLPLAERYGRLLSSALGEP